MEDLNSLVGDGDVPIETTAAEAQVIGPELALDESKIRKDPAPTPAKAKQFNPNARQDGRVDEEVEGGLYVAPTGDPFKNLDNRMEGGIMRPGKTMDEEDEPDGQYLMSGFEVQFEDARGISIRQQAKSKFADVNAAMACVNGDRYLMPDPKSGVRMCKITAGAPEISKNSVCILRYIDSEWKRP